jgi:hypothetical protein
MRSEPVSEEDLGYLVLKQLRPLIQHFTERQAQKVAEPFRMRIFELVTKLADEKARALELETRLADAERELAKSRREIVV